MNQKEVVTIVDNETGEEAIGELLVCTARMIVIGQLEKKILFNTKDVRFKSKKDETPRIRSGLFL